MATLTHFATAGTIVRSRRLLHFHDPSKSRSSFFDHPNRSFPSTIEPLTLSGGATRSLPMHPLKSSPCPPPAFDSSSSSLKSRLRDGEILYGLFMFSFSPTIAEIVSVSGYDFAVVDMEHGPGGISEALQVLRALSIPAILRLPESSAVWAKKALDIGPAGLMFPMIDSAEEARKAVSYCRFPLEGVRGSAHTVVRASNYGMDEGYLSNYAEDLLIMCQVESAEAVEKVEEIAAVDGVDCIQMGPLDLSASMGYLWDPGHRKVREMMREAEKGVVSGRAYLAGFAMPYDPAEMLARRGYHMVSGTVDVGLLRNAAVEDVRRFRLSLLDESAGDDNKDDEKYWSE